MLNVNNVDEDIKYNLVEVSGSRGVNLTSQTTRIKHNQSGSFIISSNGIINLTTANPEIVSSNEDYLYNGCINLITKDWNNMEEYIISFADKIIEQKKEAEHDLINELKKYVKENNIEKSKLIELIY